MSKQIFNLWVTGVLSTIRLIWRLRNLAIFEGKIPTRHQAIATLWSCIKEADSLDKYNEKFNIKFSHPETV